MMSLSISFLVSVILIGGFISNVRALIFSGEKSPLIQGSSYGKPSLLRFEKSQGHGMLDS